MKQKRNVWLKLSGIVFALAMVLGLMPVMGTKAYAAVQPTTVVVTYPVAGQTYLPTEPAQKLSDGCTATLNWYNGSTKTDVGALASAQGTYTVEVVLKYDSGVSDTTSVKDWKVKFLDAKSGYSMTCNTVSDATINPGAGTVSFKVNLGESGSALNPVRAFDWKYNADWSSIKPGTKAGDFTVVKKAEGDSSHKITDFGWYADLDKALALGSAGKLAAADELKGGQYYYYYVSVEMTREPENRTDNYVYRQDVMHEGYPADGAETIPPVEGASLLGIKNYDVNAFTYDASDYEQHLTFLYKVPVIGAVDGLEVSGIVSPVVGAKPVYSPIRIAVPGASEIDPEQHPESPVDVALTKATWEGDFDDYGNFKPGEKYTLTIAYTIHNVNANVYTYDPSETFAVEKITSNVGTVVKNTRSSNDEQTVEIEIISPFEITYDGNGGTGYMKKQYTEEGGKFTLPENTFTAPEGQEFDKWDLGKAGKEVTVKKNTTVKAIWKDIPKPEPKPEPQPEPEKKNPAAGEVITDAEGKAEYTVITAVVGTTNGVVEFKGYKDATANEISIPDTVTVDGLTYTVESIGKAALKGNTTVNTVVIGKNVKTIGDSAFEGCSALESVDIQSTVLNKIGKAAFKKDKKLTKITLKTKLLKKKSVGKDAIKKTSKKLTIKAPKKVRKSYLKIFKAKGNKNVKVKK